MEKDLKTEINQNMYFDAKELKDLCVHFVNGYFQWITFRVSNSSIDHEFRNLGALRELYEVLGQVIEMADNKNRKEEMKELLVKSKTRLIRIDDANNKI